MVDKGKLVEAVGYMRTSERGYVTPRRSALFGFGNRLDARGGVSPHKLNLIPT